MEKIIKYILEEDEGFGDITSNALINKDQIATAKVISKDNGILAGIDIIISVLNSKNMKIIKFLDDGSVISKGEIILEFTGNALDILLLERTILNLLMRMSGVATFSHEIVNLTRDFNVIIAGTRKTSPGISKFDKYALKVGGADTHRFCLDDMVLIKDNHISLVGSPIKALKKAQKNTSFSKKIEIEVETLEDAVECVKKGADIVMLDN
ncbi:MAG: carboxylating nicotinate-nucleotide diphosphorylase, partial [Methanobrevibacter sp.]|nr:carboxylating nicotinate-nucleotide diphosphorylase [Methanobrevibacter sp.]